MKTPDNNRSFLRLLFMINLLVIICATFLLGYVWEKPEEIPSDRPIHEYELDTFQNSLQVDIADLPNTVEYINHRELEDG